MFQKGSRGSMRVLGGMLALVASLAAREGRAQEVESSWAPPLRDSPVLRLEDSSRFTFLSTGNSGYPRVEGNRIVLIPENRSKAAAAVFLNEPVRPPFAVQFDYNTYNRRGSGPWSAGDGLVLMFGRNTPGRRVNLPAGSGRGFVPDGSGYGVHVTLYGEDRGLVLTDGSGRALASKRNPAAYTHERWSTLRVEVERDGIRVFLDGAIQIDWRGPVSVSATALGIGAGTGDANALHAIRDLRLTREPSRPQPPPPPPMPPPGPPSGGNLIINGDFEQPSLGRGSFRTLASLPGWNRSSGRSIELQNNVAGSAAQGQQFVELDGEDNTTLVQDMIPTRPGVEYELRLAFSARPGTEARDNALEVLWNGRSQAVLEANGKKLNDTAWTYVVLRVRAEGPTSRLELRDVGQSNGVGTYVDDVSLRQVSGGPRR